jgi:hypothetical protein
MKIMKTVNFKKIVASALLLLIVGYAFAFSPVVRIAGEKKIELKLNNVSENTELVIKDLNGYTFYSETIEKSQGIYAKTFDLTTLPNGTYQVELTGSVEVVSFPITIADNKITTTDIEKSVTFKPTIYEKGSKVYVSKNDAENMPLSITIFNRFNDVVYEETLNGNSSKGRIYNFSQEGQYQISMSSNDKTYTHFVTIQK